MVDFLNLLVMVFAAVAAMLFGVLTSFTIFRLVFWCMDPQRKFSFARAQVKQSVKTA